MMRIAVAGGGGLGYLIAEELANAGSAYNVVVLSTSVSLRWSREAAAMTLTGTTGSHVLEPGDRIS